MISVSLSVSIDIEYIILFFVYCIKIKYIKYFQESASFKNKKI